MLPAFRPYDLLRAGRWHTAFFSTFSLSLSFFESVPLHALRRSGARNITIVTDLVGYQASLSEAGAADVGRIYDITPLHVREGCFHAKVVLLAGDDGLRATVGSGNVTFGGWGRNIECLHYLIPSQCPEAFGDLGDFLEALVEAIDEQRIEAPSRLHHVAALRDSCRQVARINGDGRTRVLHSLRRPIADQIVQHADALGGARQFTVVSPFFGSPAAVVELAAALECEKVQICVTGRAPEFFDFAAAEKSGVYASPVRSDTFDPGRPLHAKIIEIECRKGRLVISGSANATWPALIARNNIEVSVVKIADEALSFGWTAGDRRSQSEGEGGTPYPESGDCLSARLDGHWIRGRMFARSKCEGVWTARCVGGVLQVALPAVQLDGDGAFRLDVRGIKAFSLMTRSTQLVLSRGLEEVRGWLVFDHLIGAVRERGSLAEAMIRAIAFREEVEDYRTILSFFATNPSAFLSDEIGTSSARSAHVCHGKEATTINLADLAPVDRDADPWPGAAGTGGSGAFERLLASMKRYVCEAPSPKRAQLDADDEIGEGDGNAPDERPIPRPSIDEAVDVFIQYVSTFDIDCDDFRRHAVSLLDFLLFVAERSEAPDEMKQAHLRAWKGVVKGAHARATPDVLDRSLVATTLSRLIEDDNRASEAHTRLQEWCRGTVDPTWLASAAPNAEGIRENRLVNAPQSTWDAAADATLKASTAWTTVRDVQLALQGARPMPVLPSELAEEAIKLNRVLVGNARPDAVLTLKHQVKQPACPRCCRTLLGTNLDKLRRYRISQCCGRVLLDPLLE